jgi:O-antigen/teichoic acid export membrane protein
MPDGLKRPILWSFGTQLVATTLQMLVLLLVARQLGPDGQGKLATATLPPQLLVVALNLGLGQALIYFLNQGVTLMEEARALCRQLFLRVVPAGLLIALLVQSLAGRWLYPGIPGPLLVAALPLLPATLARLWWCQLLQAKRDFRWYNRLQLLQPLLLLVLLLAALGMVPPPLSPLLVVLLMAGSQALTWAVATRVLGPCQETPPGGRQDDRGLLGRCLRYGLPSLGSNLLEFINLRGSLLLVNGFLGPHAAGLFKLDTQLGEPLLLPASAAVTVLFPQLSQADLGGQRRLTLTRTWLARCLATGLVLGAGIALIAPRLVPMLFGEGFAQALPVLPLLLPAYLCWSAVNVLWAHMAASGFPHRPLRIGLGILAVNLVANLALIPRLGLPGAALASSLTFAAGALLSWMTIPRVARQSVPFRSP